VFAACAALAAAWLVIAAKMRPVSAPVNELSSLTFSIASGVDLAGLREAFLASVPGGTEIFKPEVLKQEAAALEIQLHGCPLKDAWREAGLPEDKVATLCRIAGAVDKGLFEGAGFRIENRTWTPGAKGCCFLRILRG